MRESLILKDNGIEVVEAPDESMISLVLLAQEARGVMVHGNYIWFGTGVHAVRYLVTGWDAEHAALTLRKEQL